MSEQTAIAVALLEVLESLEIEMVIQDGRLASIDWNDIVTRRLVEVVRPHSQALKELLEARRAAVEAVEAFLQEARR